MPTHTIGGLSDTHYNELSAGSSIGDHRIQQRYYQSVSADQLPPEFADYQRRPGLLIPIRSVRGHIESWQLKPDQPRIGKNGKPIKYETAANAPQVIDCPPSAEKHLGNPKIPLVITEGAKKVDSAVSNGLPCTIGLQGVYGWRGRNEHGGKAALPDWELIALNGREVMLAFDSDVMTKREVRGALDRFGSFLSARGAKVRFLLMPDLPDGSKCGLDDWFAAGRSAEQLLPLLVKEPPDVATAAPDSSIGIPRVLTRSIADVEEHQVDWIWENWLPKGMFTILGGYAGDGKSTLTAWLAAMLSTGGTLPDGSAAPVINTLMVAMEDDISHVVKPRLSIHGVNENRVSVLDGVDEGDGILRPFNLRRHVPVLRQEVLEKNIGLVVIDPLSGVQGNGDRNNEGDVRDSMAPLFRMMEETGVAVIGIMHIGKNDGQAKSYQKLLGSTAYTALARVIWMVHDLPEDMQVEGEATRKLLDVTKINIAMAPAPMQFHRPKDQPITWLGMSPMRFDEAASWKKKPESISGKGETETAKAEAWLLEFMDGEHVLASEVDQAARDTGITFATIKKVKERICITSVREGNQWFWVPAVDRRVA